MRRTAALVIAAVIAFGARAELAREDTQTAFVVALRAYEAGEYLRAVELLEAINGDEIECARCAHLLGRSYGRLAERAGWIEAMQLARKTCSALELAVELAPYDRRALEDLIKYYRAAPAFLGGGSEKAEALERRLREAGDRTG